jgi:hypothetical protein
MPPGIKCRTCKIARQVAFIESVQDGDPDAKTVSYTRYGLGFVLLALAIILW